MNEITYECPVCGRKPDHKMQYAPRPGYRLICKCGTQTRLLEWGERLIGWEKKMERPKIVCLCGSTRFKDAYQRANLEETLAGKIVLTIGCDTHNDDELKITPVQKAALDELHLRKVDMADEILVLNVSGYVGESTSREIGYATRKGKTIRWLEMPLSSRRECTEADKEIDEIIAKGRQRMEASDPAIRGLHPAEVDWLTEEELARLDELQLQLPRVSREEAICRVEKKRQARREAAETEKGREK